MDPRFAHHKPNASTCQVESSCADVLKEVSVPPSSLRLQRHLDLPPSEPPTSAPPLSSSSSSPSSAPLFSSLLFLPLSSLPFFPFFLVIYHALNLPPSC